MNLSAPARTESTRRRSAFWRGVAAIGLALGLSSGGIAILSSCGTREVLPVKDPTPCQQQIVTMSIIASPLINPTPEGAPRPVQVRVYQLKNDIRMQNATFNQIWKDDKKTLADDIISVNEVPIYPNSRTELKFQRDETALNVIVVALFQNPQGKSWWTSFDYPPPPGKGQCGAVVGCPNGQCDGGTNLTPKYAIWIDQDRVDVGDDHIDDYPEGRIQTIQLTGGAAASGAPAASK